MKYQITATAPTTYQLRSIGHFGLPVKHHLDGSHSIKEVYDSREEAVDYLKKRADQYFETEEEIEEAYIDCERGYLRLDAVMASIDEFNEED